MRGRWVVALVIAVAASIAGGGRASALSEPSLEAGKLLLDCGEVLGDEPEETSTTTVTLGNNLICTSTAITIGSGFNGRTLDLGGHRITGDAGATDRGISIDDDANDVVVRNGVIANVGVGIDIRSDDHTVGDVTVMDTGTTGIQVIGDTNTISNARVIRSRLNLVSAASGNFVQDSTFVTSNIDLDAADANSIERNDVYDARIFLAVGADGSQNNTIESNTVIGSGFSGIAVSGDSSDQNTVSNNTVKASTNDGIDVNAADGTTVSNNVLVGNGEDGIEVRGTALGTELNGNTASANVENGIVVGNPDTVDLVGNVTNENGFEGVNHLSTTAANEISNNTANGNGFLNGLANDDSVGIHAATPPLAAVGNQANGNDVAPDAQQCSASVNCAPPAQPAADPPLHQCNTATTGDFVLRHPVDCETGSGIDGVADGSTLRLGSHRVSGGSTTVEAGVDLGPGPVTDVTIRGGVFAETGVAIRGSGVKNVVIEDVTTARTQFAAVSLVASKRNTFKRGLIVGSDGDGVALVNGDKNVFKSSTIAGTGTNGFALVPQGAEASTGNTIASNTVLGTSGTGVGLSNASENLVRGNTIVGTNNVAVQLAGAVTGSSNNVVQENTITASTPTTGAIGITATAGEDGIGSKGNKILSNIVTATATDAVNITDPDSDDNVVKGNQLLRNNGEGLHVASIGIIGTKVSKNKAHNNVSHGILFAEATSGPIKENKANANGYVADNTATPLANDFGLGIDVPEGTSGCGNKAALNDDDEQIEVEATKLTKKCP